MSARALAWAWDQAPVNSTQKLVLAALADRADDDGECFPSIEWLASKCAPLGSEGVRRALRALSEQGLVEKTRRRRRGDGTLSTWIYRLPLGEPAQWSPVGELAHADSHQDIGSSVEADASTALAVPDEKPETTQTLVAEIVDEARALDIPLPKRVTGQLARYVKQLADEGYSYDVIRAGVARMMERRIVQPALLANFVTEAALASRPASTNGRRYGRGVRNDELEAVAQRLEQEGR